ncbi:MAG: hypothetical protein ACFFDN_52380, partial [Candidatus Hodarchaeota archaeon]
TTPGNIFQKGDYNQDGFVDFNEAFNYTYNNLPPPCGGGISFRGVLSDGIYNTEDNPVDVIRPVIANVSEKYSERNTHIELNFTIDGIGYVQSINILLLDNTGDLIGNISVSVIYDKNGGQGRYYFSHTTPQMIGAYFIQVKYEYSNRNIVYNRTNPLDPYDSPKETPGGVSSGRSGGDDGDDNNGIEVSEFFVIGIISTVSAIGIISVVSIILIKKRLKR